MDMNVSDICFCGNNINTLAVEKNKKELQKAIRKQLKRSDYYATKMTLELKLVSAYMRVRNGIRKILGIKDKPVSIEDCKKAFDKMVANGKKIAKK